MCWCEKHKQSLQGQETQYLVTTEYGEWNGIL